MQNFQQILTEAAQLKEHQLKKDRKGYESLPEFLKAGLGYNKKYELIRKQNYHYQYRISNKVKEQGNAFYKQNKLDEALSKYQEALGIFRYIQSKSYENMKDQHLSYHNFDSSSLSAELREKHETHMVALYLNICSCLTKQNKKQDAILSAEQALKIKNTVKGHYRKAQAYLKYVNRDINDIKLGIFQLKQAYNIDKDPQLLAEMHAAKDNYEKQQEKSKNWFKFMLDKNKEAKENPQPQQPQQQVQKQKTGENPQKTENPANKLKKLQIQQLQKAANAAADEQQKFELAKQNLRPYTLMPENQWLIAYQKDFIKRNGSKIYSMLKIYNQEALVAEFRGLLGKCLQKQDSQEKLKKSCEECISWIRTYRIDKIKKYSQRYDLQTAWIKENRGSLNNTKAQIVINTQDKKSTQLQQKPLQNTKQQQKKQKRQEQKQKQKEKWEQEQDQEQDEQQKQQYEQWYKQNQKRYEDPQQKQQLETTDVPDQIRRLIESDESQPNIDHEKEEEEKRLKQKQNKKQRRTYITVAIVLFLLLVRFLWN